MRYYSTLLFSLFFSSLAWSQDLSPEVLASTGSSATAAGISLSWTVGEPIITTVSNSNATLTQGFHQSNLSLANLEEQAAHLQLSVFPNPTSDWLYLRSEEAQLLKWQLFSAAGQSLQQGRVEQEERIDLSTYPSGLYLLRVQDAQGHFNSYKITVRHL